MARVDKDPALVWEAETLARHRAPNAHPPPGEQPSPRAAAVSRSSPASWVTIRAAHEATGIPVSTVRTWARKGKVTGQVTDGRWMVSLEDVRRRGERLGRIPDAAKPTDSDSTWGPPTGTMIVPLDAWERMLHQLGNLHEAGQQLADARERAAKAETEAKFLREQLKALRDEADRSSESQLGESEPHTSHTESTEPPAAGLPAAGRASPDVPSESARIGATESAVQEPPGLPSTLVTRVTGPAWRRLARRLRRFR